MAKFDLKGILSQESRKEMDLPEQRIVYRSPEDLLPDKENFYNTEDIADLKESIRSLGLLQALLIEKRNDKDYIIAGHRRQKCCLELLNEGDERFRKIPCVYTVSTNMDVEDDDITRQIKLIQANSYRKKTGWEEMTEALKMVDLVQELRKKTEMEGKSRDIAAGLLGTSSTQIGRYKSVRTNLSDDFMGAFKENNISLSIAEELSRLKPEYQRQAWEHYTERGSITLPEVKAFRDLQEEHRDIPGQLTLEEAIRQQKPPENETAIAPELQIERFYEALNRTDKERVKKCDRMVPQLLFIRYSIVRIRNGFFNYQGSKEGITFNPGSRLEYFLNWNDFAKELINRFGKKKPVKMASVVEEEPKNDMPGPAKCITGQSGTGQCGAAAYCNKGYNCCAQCPDDCNGRCGWIPKKSCQPATEAPDEKQHDFVEPTEIEEHIVEDNKTSDHVGDPAEMLPENWPEYLKDIPIPTETALASYLYDQERDLRQILNIEKEEPGLPHMTIMQQQMVVAGLRILQNYIENTKEPEQPPLPEMKNNDQRKEWLRNYKSWGLWYTDHHTGVRYYKYDFQNGARLIAQEYDPEPQKSSWWVPTESYYMHLVGGPEPASKNKIPKWTYHEKYNRFPNSETELVEFLKEVQR
jgi:ParB-like chromosome segregation protein Spo0J